MPELKASRTLVKSAPELWAECSDATSLTRHLGAFGEIRITKLEPETAVAWEGEDVRGTVTLEPSGWGTRVVLRATPDAGPGGAHPDPEPAAEPEVEADVEAEAADGPGPITVPEASPEPDSAPPPPRRGLFGRLFGRFWRREPAAWLGPDGPRLSLTAEPEATSASQREHHADPDRTYESNPNPEPAPPPTAFANQPPELVALVDALDSLGTAHRRPFSRS